MEKQGRTKYTIQRIGGYLHKLAPIVDSTGKVVDYVITPLMIELRPRDAMQIIVGASILAIPVGFTEEVWNLGKELSLANVVALGVISVAFIAAYVYFNFYRYHLKDHLVEYVKRVLAVYLLSLVVVGVLLTLIEKCPWKEDSLAALKLVIMVAFPASMSAAVSDTVK